MPQFILDKGEAAPAFDALDDFTQAYIEALFFTEEERLQEEGLEAPAVSDLAPETLKKAIADCERFQRENKGPLEAAYLLEHRTRNGSEPYTATQAGHDFWLTRNGHGAGFWDRGLGSPGEFLSKRCGWRTDFPECSAYLGDDQKIYTE